MTSITVRVPIKTTNPTNGSHGTTRAGMFARARAKKAQRSAVALMLQPVMLSLARLIERGQITVTLTRRAPSNGLDDDNLRPALKAARDAVADALGVDDRDPRITWNYAQMRGPYAVEIAIGGARP